MRGIKSRSCLTEIRQVACLIGSVLLGDEFEHGAGIRLIDVRRNIIVCEPDIRVVPIHFPRPGRVAWTVRKIARISWGSRKRRSRRWANCGEVSRALSIRGDGQVVEPRRVFVPKFLRVEEEQLVPHNRTANGTAEVVLLVRADWLVRRIEEILRIEELIAEVFEQFAMKLVGTGLCYSFDGATAAPAVLSVIAGSKDLHLIERIDVRKDIEIGHAAAIHHIAAIDFPVIEFSAATVDRVRNAAAGSRGSRRLSGLIADARGKLNQLNE